MKDFTNVNLATLDDFARKHHFNKKFSNWSDTWKSNEVWSAIYLRSYVTPMHEAFLFFSKKKVFLTRHNNHQQIWSISMVEKNVQTIPFLLVIFFCNLKKFWRNNKNI